MELLEDLIDVRIGLEREAREELVEEATCCATGSVKIAVTLALEGEEDGTDLGKLGEGVCEVVDAEGVPPVL
ncbi:MAG: hypothetical protein EXR55_02280 [Dehalococcoidia bacterium]|nr:hypothetical protein [Dehalococcoidia bacterium]